MVLFPLSFTKESSRKFDKRAGDRGRISVKRSHKMSRKNISHCESCYRLHRTGFMLSTVIFFLSILFFFLGCQGNVPPPQHLIGVWKTSAPQYEDRYLRITEDSLIYGIGRGEEVSHTIERINVEQEDGETIYIFHYKDKGEKWSLTLIYSPLSGGTIRLKNKNDIWEKVEPESPG